MAPGGQVHCPRGLGLTCSSSDGWDHPWGPADWLNRQAEAGVRGLGKGSAPRGLWEGGGHRQPRAGRPRAVGSSFVTPLPQ